MRPVAANGADAFPRDGGSIPVVANRNGPPRRQGRQVPACLVVLGAAERAAHDDGAVLLHGGRPYLMPFRQGHFHGDQVKVRDRGYGPAPRS